MPKITIGTTDPETKRYCVVCDHTGLESEVEEGYCPECFAEHGDGTAAYTEAPDDDDLICGDCNGTGEGYHDGTICRACSGSGAATMCDYDGGYSD